MLKLVEVRRLFPDTERLMELSPGTRTLELPELLDVPSVADWENPERKGPTIKIHRLALTPYARSPHDPVVFGVYFRGVFYFAR